MGRYVALILMFVSSCYALAKEEGRLDEGLVNPGFVQQPSWFKQSFLDLPEDVSEAAQSSKRLVLFFYQDGCPYCEKLIRNNFSQKQIVDLARSHFDIVSINMWGDRDVVDLQGVSGTEKQLAEKLGVMFTPTVIFLNEQGKSVLRINGYYHPAKFMTVLNYVAEKQENTISWRGYLLKHNPPKADAELNQGKYILPGPYDLSSLSAKGKKTLLLFEQKDCPACDELHRDILQRPESKKLLSQFQVLQLDMWSSELVKNFQRKPVKMKDLAESMNILYAPSAVFLDEQGREVFRMEAYLKAFHVQSSMDYVASNAYRQQPSFQRYIEDRADALRERGHTIQLMK